MTKKSIIVSAQVVKEILPRQINTITRSDIRFIPETVTYKINTVRSSVKNESRYDAMVSVSTSDFRC
jgi:hypothetical protein